MTDDFITIRGARQHNLKNIDLRLPKGQLIVFSGLSGSGKSSLAFDTLHAEAQRRYVESLSPYARQILGQISKPDVDSISGLSPSIALAQGTTTAHPRSTVGTATEIYDYLRLLYARVATAHCPRCGSDIAALTVQEIVDRVLCTPEGSRLLVLAPKRPSRGGLAAAAAQAQRDGFVRARIRGTIVSLDSLERLDIGAEDQSFDVVVDRLIVSTSGEGGNDTRSRLADSVETALHVGGHRVRIAIEGEAEYLYTDHWVCPRCDLELPNRQPRLFSFNVPEGACPRCEGLGSQLEFDPERALPNRSLSLDQGAIAPWGVLDDDSLRTQLMDAAARLCGHNLDDPLDSWTAEQVSLLLEGPREPVSMQVRYIDVQGKAVQARADFPGVLKLLSRQYEETRSPSAKASFEQFMVETPCPQCSGRRLRPEALAFTIDDLSIAEVAERPFRDLLGWLDSLLRAEQATVLPERDRRIAEHIVAELRDRVATLLNLGLDYLTCQRPMLTLSSGESQRTRLAAQLGLPLTGLLYVLDEPTQGLHPVECASLVSTLHHLRDLGNTVIVVEHDEQVLRAADWIVDFGPGAGSHGGRVVAEGTEPQIEQSPASLTGRYLKGELSVPVPSRRRRSTGHLIIHDAHLHNLKNVTIQIPVGGLVAVAGVSGAGKSSLIIDVLLRAARHVIEDAPTSASGVASIEGLEVFTRVVFAEQLSAIRSPRSTPISLISAFAPIRELFAQTPEARVRGYRASRFSFNVRGGRCEACEGLGTKLIDLQFLPAIQVPCEVCQSRRYNRETLGVRYHGLSIADVLDLTVEDALNLFAPIPAVTQRLEPLRRVGAGYLPLGQPASTLSGGEAQRLRMAGELTRRGSGPTLFIFDEPTTGLHFADVRRLLDVLTELIDAGNTVVVIEHNIDILKSADWIVELGPEAGADGGYIIASGTPERLAAFSASRIGMYLRRVLS